MATKRKLTYFIVSCTFLLTACSIPSTLVPRKESDTTPANYNSNLQQDSVNSAKVKWRNFFTDQNLIALIDTALGNNQELNITLQEINIARNEVRARKGEYLPFVGAMVGAGVEKPGRYTAPGALEENVEIEPGRRFPDPLSDYSLGLNASWELDIWRKLRNAKKSAVFRYLSTTEGKNFLVTNLVAEIASSYYELMALDNRLDILRKNIEIQQNALNIVRMQKQAAKVTELAVRKFEAEVLKNQSRQYEIKQGITETENRINFLVGRFPQTVQRNSQTFTDILPDTINAGLPSQLLLNRPDIRQAELDLATIQRSQLDARVELYRALGGGWK